MQTQVARTYGLRADFARAQAVLKGIEPQLQTAGEEARSRYWLELGRTYASGTHSPESQTSDVKAMARGACGKALATAKAGQLDGLAVDALHMLAFVDTAPADQLKWGQAALAVSDTQSWKGATAK